MNKNFIVTTVFEDGVEYVLLDNVFRAKDIIVYAIEHNFPIKFICTTYTCACQILAEIQDNGYLLTFKKVPIYWQGSVIDYSIEVFCNKID